MLPLVRRWFLEQLADIHNRSRRFSPRKGCGARLDGANLPPPMVLAENIRIVIQHDFEFIRVHSRAAVSGRNRGPKVGSPRPRNMQGDRFPF